MKQFISSKTYSELWKVLEEKTEVRTKIPEDVLKHIYKNAINSGYRFEYTSKDDILKIISKDTFCLYVSLYLQYVAEDDEKEKIKKILIDNEIKYKTAK